jgi:hypothetical protein
VRLIDADKLKLEIIKSHEYHGDTSELISALERDIRIIDEQPTAYDVDNVIEEMIKEFKKYYGDNWDKAPYLVRVIEIVKRGGSK